MQMNKQEFILELEKKLKKLPEEERQTALTYYKEYFAEAGEDKEQEVIKEIGTPSEVASQIMANFIVKENNLTKEDNNVKRSLSTTWIVILTILASPIALPIAIVIITLIFVTWIVIITFWITGVACILAGGIYMILSLFAVFQDFYLMMTILGSGMIAISFGIAVTIGSSNLFIKYASWITTKLSKFLLRKEKHNEE